MAMNKTLVKLVRCNKIGNFARSVASASDGGIKYYGFTYYPRFPGKEDPPCQPSKLFMVKRLGPVKGNPYWEKKLLKEFHLDGKNSEIAIVKNIPENNARLWRIKHLIQVTPITFPNGEPTEEDIGATYLKENGEFVVSQTIKVDAKRLEAGVKCREDNLDIDGETLRKQLRLKWINPWK